MIDNKFVLGRLDLEGYYRSLYPDLKINGEWGQTRCHFNGHQDSKPSLFINLKNGSYHCKGCGVKGSIFDHYMEVHGVDFSGAKEALAMQAGLLPGPQRKISKTYPYTDGAGNLLFEVVRYTPKGFSQRRPDGKGGWIYNLQGMTPVLYYLPEIIKSDTVYICEGEKDCDNLKALGLVATTNPMGAGKWRAEYSSCLKDKEVIILPDNDQPGRDHAWKVAKSLYSIAKSVKISDLPDLPEKGDVSDWIETRKNERKETEEIRRGLLDLVMRTPDKPKEFETTGQDVSVAKVPLTGNLLLKISDLLRRHLFFKDRRYPLLIAIWILGTYIHRNLKFFGYLWVTSPLRRCAKSLLLDILTHLCFNATPRLSNVTEAAILRLAHLGHTLILDELENLRSEDRDKYGAIMSLLNNGFQADGKTPRVERGKDNKFNVVYYDVYSPKVLAGINRLADTIEDRCFKVPMVRKTRDERVERFNFRRQAGKIEELREEIRLWAETRKESIQKIYDGIEDVEDLSPLDDRFKDIAEPLVAIASYSDAEGEGGEARILPQLVSLFLDMAGKRQDGERQESIGAFVQLADEILGSGDEVFISSEDLLIKVKDMEDLSWIGSAKAMAAYLAKFDLSPERNMGRTKRGYRITRAWMEDVRDRYLSIYVGSEVSDVSQS